MYIMFPIGWMYYFGANLEERFSVPDFWPKENETHHIPFEKDEIQSELARLRARRLAARQRRFELEGNNEPVEQHIEATPSPILESLRNTDQSSFQQPQQPEQSTDKPQSQGWFSWLK
jgi:protein PET100